VSFISLQKLWHLLNPTGIKMKKSRTLCIAIPLSCFTLNAIAAATWVDNRYAHTTASEKNQYKIGLGHIFDNGAGVLASAMYDLGQDFNQMKSSFQEFEGWFRYRLMKNGR